MDVLIWVCLKMVSTPKPNGFADHYPYEKWLAIIGNINPTCSDKPIYSTPQAALERWMQLAASAGQSKAHLLLLRWSRSTTSAEIDKHFKV